MAAVDAVERKANSIPAKEIKPSIKGKKTSADKTYNQYLVYFEEIYNTMMENYYAPVARSEFDRFINQFNTKIYKNLADEGKSDDYVKWRSASMLISFLKTQEDVFSELYPPKPAQEYVQTALGVRHDLGIEGHKTDHGLVTTQVEPRSDAYQEGLRIGDVIIAIDSVDIVPLAESEINNLLSPLAGTQVIINYVVAATQTEKSIEVTSKDFFKQTVFDVSTNVPNIYCLKIERFNRKTAEDLYRFLQYYKSLGPIMGLIIDLRGNPGGPPLAAREISGFFLEGGDDFAYFQKKNQPEAHLDVPALPEELKYDGPMVVLIDKGSGSASELFSGVMQRKGRTILMGQNSAGQVMLKSMFNFDDGSMVLLITSRGHYPDGGAFSFSGLTPDRYIKEEENLDIVDYASKYLIYVNMHPEILEKLKPS